MIHFDAKTTVDYFLDKQKIYCVLFTIMTKWTFWVEIQLFILFFFVIIIFFCADSVDTS